MNTESFPRFNTFPIATGPVIKKTLRLFSASPGNEHNCSLVFTVPSTFLRTTGGRTPKKGRRSPRPAVDPYESLGKEKGGGPGEGGGNLSEERFPPPSPGTSCLLSLCPAYFRPTQK